MSNYELCKRAKLDVIYGLTGEYIKASEVEEMLQNAKVVYGFVDNEGHRFNETKYDADTHQARLVMIEKLPKNPLVVVKEFTRYEHDCLSKMVIIPEQFEGKKFKVTFEEVE